jgi:hypothetical protein
MDVPSHCRIGWSRGNTGERRVVDRVLVGKPEGKRPLGRPKHKWECNIKIDLLPI